MAPVPLIAVSAMTMAEKIVPIAVARIFESFICSVSY